MSATFRWSYLLSSSIDIPSKKPSYEADQPSFLATSGAPKVVVSEGERNFKGSVTNASHFHSVAKCNNLPGPEPSAHLLPLPTTSSTPPRAISPTPAQVGTLTVSLSFTASSMGPSVASWVSLV